MKIVKTVTVGIPVYNEEENIKYLLSLLVKQRTSNCQLEKIVILCDGSADSTPEKALDFAKNYPRLVRVIKSTVRRGKMQRLMQLYSMNKSDYLVIFDGDIVPSDKFVVENLVKQFKENKVAVVGANNQPVGNDTFVRRLLNAWFRLWYDIRMNVNEGDNIYNLRGCAMALEKRFAKDIFFPKGLISDSKYIYALAKSKGLRFRFANDAKVFYLLPSNMVDYFMQKRRAVSDTQLIENIFGEKALGDSNIPLPIKIRSIVKMMLANPIITPLAILFVLLAKHFRYSERTVVNNRWSVASSTKRGIEIAKY